MTCSQQLLLVFVCIISFGLSTRVRTTRGRDIQPYPSTDKDETSLIEVTSSNSTGLLSSAVRVNDVVKNCTAITTALISSSSYDFFPAQLAFDDNTNEWDIWQSTFDQLPQYIQLDFYNTLTSALCAFSITSRLGLYAYCDSPLGLVLKASTVQWLGVGAADRQWTTVYNGSLPASYWSTAGNETKAFYVPTTVTGVTGVQVWITDVQGRAQCCKIENVWTDCSSQARKVVAFAEVDVYQGGASIGADCVVSNWTAGNCSVSCGEGIITQTRKVISFATGNGAPCPTLSQTAPCNLVPCGNDCAVSGWTTGACDVTCGTGTMTRTRSVTQKQSGDGAPCPDLSETIACTLQPCEVSQDCVVGDWVPGACSTTCGDGTQTLTRKITQYPSNGGAACPDASTLKKTQPCNLAPCPTDCVLGPERIGACSVTCGIGVRVVQRTEQTPATNGGAECVPENRVETCQEPDCPVDCKLGDPVQGPCSVTCGQGIRQTVTPIIRSASNGGKACPDPSELRVISVCTLDLCPINCVVGPWQAGECSVTCGGGTMTLVREVTTNSAHGGKACPTDLVKVQACNTKDCPIDCQLSDWRSGVCSTSCDPGVITSTRTVTVPPGFGGQPCPGNLTKTSPCNLGPCGVDCVVSSWLHGACSATCGWGLMTSTRTVVIPNTGNGIICPPLIKTSPCNLRPCIVPEDCEVSDWVITKECSEPCGDGVVVRTRYVLKGPQNGGKPCPPDLEATQPCNLRPCEPIDCVVSDWIPGPCSTPCGDGIMPMTRQIVTPARYGGKECPCLEELSKKAPCNIRPCENPEIVDLEKKLAILEEQNRLLRERTQNLLSQNPDGLTGGLQYPATTPSLPPSDQTPQYVVHLPIDV